MTNKIFAAKHIKTRRREQKSKALEEVLILQKLSNPHIISFVIAYETPGEVIFIMEYLEKVADDADNGVSLRKLPMKSLL